MWFLKRNSVYRISSSNCFWIGSFWISNCCFSLSQIWNLEICLTWITFEIFKVLENCFQKLNSFIFSFVLLRRQKSTHFVWLCVTFFNLPIAKSTKIYGQAESLVFKRTTSARVRNLLLSSKLTDTMLSYNFSLSDQVSSNVFRGRTNSLNRRNELVLLFWNESPPY